MKGGNLMITTAVVIAIALVIAIAILALVCFGAIGAIIAVLIPIILVVAIIIGLSIIASIAAMGFKYKKHQDTMRVFDEMQKGEENDRTDFSSSSINNSKDRNGTGSGFDFDRYSKFKSEAAAN
jgi:O-antigen ligase